MTKVYKLSKVNQVEHPGETDQTRFTINYKNELNPGQFEAVSAVKGNYLLIAGAGTGKTRTLVYRVARLIELGYDPSSILLLTFTRKAATEMMSRASALLDNRCTKINGGTFHSFANLTLRRFSKLAGLDSSFTILDQGDSEDVINLIRSQQNIEKFKKRFPKKNTIYKMISLSVNKDIPVEKIIETEYPHFLEFSDIIIKINSVFSEYKQKNNMVDYDDLLVCLKNLVFSDSPKIKTFLTDIKFVMVDEYQDTNKLQADIIRGLARFNNNVMVVGDDSQSIYSFRGADFKNIMSFPELFPGCKIIKLEQNYRSTQNILNFTNYLIDQAIEKYPKTLFSYNNKGELPAIIAVNDDNMQSRFIADKILDLREEGIPLQDIAVLFRSSYFSFDLEIELNKANIPFQKFGGMKFIETSHVKDVLSFLRLLVNPRDMISWYRILLLHEGIGPKKAQAVLDEISNGSLTINVQTNIQILKNHKPSISNLFITLNKLYNMDALPVDKAEYILEYYQPLFKSNYDDYNKRTKDLEILISIASNYKSLNSLLTDMALDPPRDSLSDVTAEEKEKEFITLSTIHSAKGLEWHSVFIINLVDGFFPSAMSFGSIEELEEERRLMYVASTRAKQNLLITYPLNIFDRQNGYTFSKPSRFIQGVSEELAENWIIEE